jgi:hypothetical protein
MLTDPAKHHVNRGSHCSRATMYQLFLRLFTPSNGVTGISMRRRVAGRNVPVARTAAYPTSMARAGSTEVPVIIVLSTLLD